MDGTSGMTFNPDLEYGNCIPGEGFASGKEYIDAIIEDAKKTLPSGTAYSFISWSEGGKRKAGWVYNLQTHREQEKLFNPLMCELRT